MKIKKILSVLLTLCLFVNVSFAFDPYADEEVEKKSYKKLYYGIALTLLGGFLAYDGFSLEKVDASKPNVDFLSVSHSEWVQLTGDKEEESDDEAESNDKTKPRYQLRSGISLNNVPGIQYYNTKKTRIVDYSIYEVKKNSDVNLDDNTNTGLNEQEPPYDPADYDRYTVEPNILYNNGNVDLRDITIEVRYKFSDGYIGVDDRGVHHTDKNGRYSYEDEEGNIHYDYVKDQAYHTAEIKAGTIDYYNEKDEAIEIKDDDERVKVYENLELKKGASLTWQDVWEYTTDREDSPADANRANHFYDPLNEDPDKKYDPGTNGLNLGKNSTVIMEVRVKLKKNQQYTPIYETKHKSDLEGVAGMFIGIAGLYFIIDHFFDMHKFNAYAKRHHLNLKIATAANQYKLMLQKRI